MKTVITVSGWNQNFEFQARDSIIEYSVWSNYAWIVFISIQNQKAWLEISIQDFSKDNCTYLPTRCLVIENFINSEAMCQQKDGNLVDIIVDARLV